jgi:hypothetical protein
MGALSKVCALANLDSCGNRDRRADGLNEGSAMGAAVPNGGEWSCMVRVVPDVEILKRFMK